MGVESSAIMRYSSQSVDVPSIYYPAKRLITVRRDSIYTDAEVFLHSVATTARFLQRHAQVMRRHGYRLELILILCRCLS